MPRCHRGVALLLAFGVGIECAGAADSDAGKLVERLQAGFVCPNESVESMRENTRYVGDTKVFRLAMRQSGTAPGDKYEIAFNFADLAAIRNSGSSVVFVCRQQTGISCVVRPRALGSSNPYEYTAVACDGRAASDVRDASEALMRLNIGVPTAGLPMIWEAPARQEAFWLHNGSTLNLVAQGNARKFYYREPSSRLEELGVTAGTLLFDGRRTGNQYAGTAYVFNRACGPLGYVVNGVVSGDDRQVILQGRAPRRDRDCAVVDHRDDVLTFTLQDQ